MTYGKQTTTNIDEVIKNIESSNPMYFVHLGADGGFNKHMTGHHNPFGLLIAEVKRLRGLLKANSCCTACGKYLGQCNDEDECIRLGGWTMEEAKVIE
ncbi:MAG: hypothetical protein ACTSVR_06785 [Candidatus Thorarchaeota archaeon]